jgi:hypothetical protein
LILKKTSCRALKERKKHYPNFTEASNNSKPRHRRCQMSKSSRKTIKALMVGPLHSHLVRERHKTVPELYDQFAKFSKSEVQHFRKLEQQRKVPKSDEAPKNRYGDNQCNYLRPVHSIGPDCDIPPENWSKNSTGPRQQRDPRTWLRLVHTKVTILHAPWRQGRPPHKRLPYLP